MNNKANEAQTAALIRFAAYHGDGWKAQLATTSYPEDDAHLLRQVRSYGTAWLENFQLEGGEAEMNEFLARYK